MAGNLHTCPSASQACERTIGCGNSLCQYISHGSYDRYRPKDANPHDNRRDAFQTPLKAREAQVRLRALLFSVTKQLQVALQTPGVFVDQCQKHHTKAEKGKVDGSRAELEGAGRGSSDMHYELLTCFTCC